MGKEGDESRMPLWEHLDDLRKVIVRSLIAVGLGLIVTYNYSGELVLFLEQPLLKVLPEGNRHLYFTGITDKFMVYLLVSFLSSVVLCAPYLFYQLWLFVAPALYKNERRMVLPFVFFGTFAFLVGLLFGFKVVLPYSYEFLIHFGGESDRAIITLGEYFSLTLKLLFGIALIFELPVVLILLSRFGFVTHPFLVQSRKYAFMAIATLSAIITPSPDAVTMIMVMVPLLLLYEISVLGVKWVGKSPGILAESK